MLRSIQQRDLPRNRWIKVAMTVFLVLICASMLTYLIPGLMTGTVDGSSPDNVATVGGQNITVVDFQQQFNRATRGQSIPQMMRGLYASQVLDQMIFQRAVQYEAERLGIRVTDDEETEQIREMLPSAWEGGVWQKDRYASEVQTNTQMSVEEFENALRDEMLMNKFRELVTDGVTVSPAEVEQQFRWRNEKVKIAYALIKPGDLASSIHPSDAELSAWFAQNSLRYQIPEKRSAHYALLDLAKLRAGTNVSNDMLRDYYTQHIDEYKVENRVHAEHILFKTIGKTDAEIAEIRQKAEDVLKQAKHGANFEDLAKKYSEDDISKPKGGDLGWIVEGQTVPEFQQAAFGLEKGTIADLVKTQYGFHIIKVLDRESAHTKSLEEVRDSVLQPVLDERVNETANDISNQMATAVRQSDRQSLDELAKKFHLDAGDTAPVAITDPILPLGNTSDLHQALFTLRPGELSQPIQIASGFVIFTAKEILPAHQGTLAEIRERVLSDYQHEKAVDAARTGAEELSKRARSGEDFDKAAKSLSLSVKTSESFSRDGTVPDVGTGTQIALAFNLSVGQVSVPTQIGENWVVYKVLSHDAPNPDEFAKQKESIQQQLLQTKQSAAFAAFRTALTDRLKKEGKLTINATVMNRFTHPSS
jgi:peptidyl-prolyl cis-trans isomerase D